MAETNAEQEAESLASVMRSPLDDRVWCAVVPDDDQWNGTMHASTSARRCKVFAQGRVAQALDLALDDLVWRREGTGSWELYERVIPPGQVTP